MGTALAFAFDRAGSSVTMCATHLDQAVLDAMGRDRVHPALDLAVPSSVAVAGPDEWAEAIGKAEIVAVAVASQGVRPTVVKASPHISEGAMWAIASKGWDVEGAEPMSRIVAGVSARHPVVVVVGPSLAGELAAGIPTGLVCASRDLDAARTVAGALSSSTVRAFITDDVAGVEVGAALKNVLAIAIGMCDGVAETTGRPMTNTKAALFSRGLVEMARLARALGGRHETILGLAGAGDLFVTVLGGRNGRFGRLVGTGLEPRKAFEEMGTTVEGYENAASAVALADRLALDLPVVRMVHSVLYKGVPASEAVESVMLGPVEPEQ